MRSCQQRFALLCFCLVLFCFVCRIACAAPPPPAPTSANKLGKFSCCVVSSRVLTLPKTAKKLMQRLYPFPPAALLKPFYLPLSLSLARSSTS